MVFERFFSKNFFLLALFSLLSVQISFASPAKDEHGTGENEQFDVKNAVFHHLLDAYEWEFGPWGSIKLPRILYNRVSGKLDFFANTDAAIHAGYVDAHHIDPESRHGALYVPEVKNVVGDVHHGTNSDEAHEPTLHAAHVEAPDHQQNLSEYKPLDFSITKNALYMFFAAALLIILMSSVARAYKKREGQAPRGMQSFFEVFIVFIRDEIAIENIGKDKYKRYMPLLLTLFFFILFLNLMGLTPFSGNVTGNISVTLGLSLVALFFTNVYANKGYWKHIFWPPVPHGIKPIMIPLEILGILTKPFALTMRLFANITAGHVMIISLISLIFIFGDNGRNAVAGWGVGIFSTLFILAISLLELFVALLQAYVFTMLTSVFIGQSVEDHHHDEHHEDAHHAHAAH